MQLLSRSCNTAIALCRQPGLVAEPQLVLLPLLLLIVRAAAASPLPLGPCAARRLGGGAARQLLPHELVRHVRLVGVCITNSVPAWQGEGGPSPR